MSTPSDLPGSLAAQELLTSIFGNQLKTAYSTSQEIETRVLDADLNEETFESMFEKLMDDVRKHVKEEEAPGGILETAEASLDRERLSKMANEMLKVQRSTQEDLAA